MAEMKHKFGIEFIDDFVADADFDPCFYEKVRVMPGIRSMSQLGGTWHRIFFDLRYEPDEVVESIIDALDALDTQ